MTKTTRKTMVKAVNVVCLTAGAVGVATLCGFTGFGLVLVAAVVATSVLVAF